MRLGKIEKYILCWIHRQHDPPEDYQSKSGALLSYARKHYSNGIPKHAYNIKSHMPNKIYNKLHVSFFRSLKSLEEKGLVEYKYCQNPRLVLEEYRRKKHTPHFDFLLVYRPKKRTPRRKSVFKLTEKGKNIAAYLIRQGHTKGKLLRKIY
jgi:hypothetical protein